MPSRRNILVLAAALALSGCKNRSVPPESPMPPNTVLLSTMMRSLSAQPGFTQHLLDQIEGAKAGPRHGPALLTPTLADELRKRILGNDWSGLDRFPGWTMREIDPAVRAITDVAHKSTSAGTPQWLDLGPYALDRPSTVALDQPSTLPDFTTDGIVTDLGDGVTRGDGPNPQLAPSHAASQRLADVLNRLAVNGETGVPAFTATGVGDPASTPEDLIRNLQTAGYTVTVTDSRYFANFGHLHFRGQDVMMPFWVNTQIAVPHTAGLFTRARPLLVPVSHAEIEWHITPPANAPQGNIDISWYFGIDGKAEWRTMDTLDQAWVGKRNAHTWTGNDAVQVTRMIAAFTRAYLHQHARRPELLFGGYYTLGVCQDAVSAIEHSMTGRVTLFPNTADASLFDDPRDPEVNAMLELIPKDRDGAPPQPERIFGSLPYAPSADPAHAFDAVTIPGLAADLNASYAAWRAGKLERTHGRLFYAGVSALVAVAGGFALGMAARRRKRLRRP